MALLVDALDPHVLAHLRWHIYYLWSAPKTCWHQSHNFP